MIAKNWICLMSMAVAPFVAGTAQATFIAYNDFAAPNSTGNVTSYRLGLGGTTSGLLTNYADGAATGVTLTIGGGYLATDTTGYNASGDALALFGPTAAPTLDERGRMFGASGSAMTFTFTGLAPTGRYDFAMYSADYPNGYTEKLVISDLSSFTNTSSASTLSAIMAQSTTTMALDTSTMQSVSNGGGGSTIFRYSSIDPGSDGDFTITITGTTPGFTIPAPSAMRLAQVEVVPEPSTYAMALAGLACGGYSLFRRRKRA